MSEDKTTIIKEVIREMNIAKDQGHGANKTDLILWVKDLEKAIE